MSLLDVSLMVTVLWKTLEYNFHLMTTCYLPGKYYKYVHYYNYLPGSNTRITFASSHNNVWETLNRGQEKSS